MSATAADHVFPGADWERATPESQGVDAGKLNEAMAWMEQFTLDQGVSQALVIRNGRMIWAGEDIDNCHPVWSCTKSYTSICLGLMVDDGACRLDDRIADYVPSLAEHYPAETIRQFATFTAGYAAAGAENDESFTPLDPAPALYPPGERFHYSAATDQVSHAVTRMAGESLRSLFARRVAEPIGINPAGWTWGDWGAVDGLTVNCGSGLQGRGVWTSARQIARVGWLIANRGRWGDREILGADYVEAATRPQPCTAVAAHDPAGWYVRLPGSYGINWWTNGVAVADGRKQWPHAPEGTCALQGNNNNICFAVPEWSMVLVRLGTDGIINTDNYDRCFELIGEGLR